MAVKLNKKILVHTTAGVAVAALLIFGISQCSEKKTIQETTNEQLENVSMALGKARKSIENFLEIKDSLSNQIDEQAKEIVLQADSIVVLNDLVKSQADSIVVLNDSNYKTRLTQYCEFDIVRRLTNYSSMEYVAGNWYDENAQSLQFSKQRILFEDQEPKFEVTEEYVEGDNVPVYLLPNGKQTIAFKPDYSAYYKFDLEDSTGLNLSVIDTDGNAVKDNGYYDLKFFDI